MTTLSTGDGSIYVEVSAFYDMNCFHLARNGQQAGHALHIFAAIFILTNNLLKRPRDGIPTKRQQ